MLRPIRLLPIASPAIDFAGQLADPSFGFRSDFVANPLTLDRRLDVYGGDGKFGGQVRAGD